MLIVVVSVAIAILSYPVPDPNVPANANVSITGDAQSAQDSAFSSLLADYGLSFDMPATPVPKTNLLYLNLVDCIVYVQGLNEAHDVKTLGEFFAESTPEMLLALLVLDVCSVNEVLGASDTTLSATTGGIPNLPQLVYVLT